MKRTKILILTVSILTLAAAGCSGDSMTDPCDGNRALSGRYNNSTTPTMALTLEQCGTEVTGSLNYLRQNYKVEGSVRDGVLQFNTDQIDLCGTAGVRRSLGTTNDHLEVANGGQNLLGTMRVTDVGCENNRAFRQNSGQAFNRQ